MIDNTGISYWLRVSVNADANFWKKFGYITVGADKIEVLKLIRFWKMRKGTLHGVLSEVSKCVVSEKTIFQNMVVL